MGWGSLTRLFALFSCHFGPKRVVLPYPQKSTQAFKHYHGSTFNKFVRAVRQRRVGRIATSRVDVCAAGRRSRSRRSACMGIDGRTSRESAREVSACKEASTIKA